MNRFDTYEYYEHHEKNAEGYSDPTYFNAVKSIEFHKGRSADTSRKYKLMGIIFAACDAMGYEVAERIVLRDKYTGKVYK